MGPLLTYPLPESISTPFWFVRTNIVGLPTGIIKMVSTVEPHTFLRLISSYALLLNKKTNSNSGCLRLVSSSYHNQQATSLLRLMYITVLCSWIPGFAIHTSRAENHQSGSMCIMVSFFSSTGIKCSIRSLDLHPLVSEIRFGTQQWLVSLSHYPLVTSTRPSNFCSPRLNSGFLISRSFTKIRCYFE